MAKRIGKKTILLETRPSITGYASVVGKKESEGPLAKEFDKIYPDSRFGENSYEKAESRMQKIAMQTALQKTNISETDIDIAFAGDLLNQCIGSTFALRNLMMPLVGIYGACSTMSLGIALAALAVESGAANISAAVTSSHFCSAERQYRFPLEYGNQRPQSAQWTVTGAGATIISHNRNKPYINAVSIGAIEDLGVKDANNMGAAMAPAAKNTLYSFFTDTNTTPEDYDIIITGDLGKVGTDILYDLMLRDGYDLRCRHNDCGIMMYDLKGQDVHAGGSGAGCSAAVLNSFVMHRFEDGCFKNILFVSTGALLSPTSALQGETIPGIAHLINIKV